MPKKYYCKILNEDYVFMAIRKAAKNEINALLQVVFQFIIWEALWNGIIFVNIFFS